MIFNFFSDNSKQQKIRLEKVRRSREIESAMPLDLAKQYVLNNLDLYAECKVWVNEIPDDILQKLNKCHETIKEFFSKYQSVLLLETSHFLSADFVTTMSGVHPYLGIGQYGEDNDWLFVCKEKDASVYLLSKASLQEVGKDQSLFHMIMLEEFPTNKKYVDEYLISIGQEPIWGS